MVPEVSKENEPNIDAPHSTKVIRTYRHSMLYFSKDEMSNYSYLTLYLKTIIVNDISESTSINFHAVPGWFIKLNICSSQQESSL